jgi:hypothetical protein
MRTLAKTIAAAAFVGLAVPAIGAPLAYDEAISGDLPIDGTLPLLQLDIGTNTVTGTTGIGGGGRFDPDSFSFALPTGAHVDSITMVPISVILHGATNNTAAWQLNHTVDSPIVSFLSTDPVAFFPGAMPLATSPFLINWSLLGCGCSAADDFWQGSYVLSLVVSSDAAPVDVPEPATLLLLGAGLAALGGTGIRRHAKGGLRVCM